MALEHSSQDTYVQIREAVIDCYPDSDVPPFHRVKTILADLSGVESLVDHMCINSCTAFVGPYADYDMCPECGQHRFDQIKFTKSNGRIKNPRAVFHTIPIGPQLQALWRNPESAEKMHYRERRTQEIFDELERNDGLVDAYDDILTGSAYLNAVRDGRIKTEDMLLIISIDGAQLYESKSSDCWIYIWIVIEHSPDQRYKKKNVLPGAIIPGPNKPKFIESFLFPGFHYRRYILSCLVKQLILVGIPIEDIFYIREC